ncbi:hypothetical protein HYPSUDRAFT_58284 [Hypholoma sublateritium FD-334 SS-4]|uniref:Uncharacterized protein n=1 Tax=Hypholoma sublateritium (strain FD-334 SS-4) TaxID=945553 RepID=A0A0D2P7K0_HYPSF|nr:hypothetical protein HYPSUDRAFT_58284 [Hypholoma sublateritium FD-334 SS-4]
MPASPNKPTRHDAQYTSLPFDSVPAASLKSGTKLYIFPPTSSTPTPEAQPTLTHSTPQATVATIALFPTEGPTIQVHFCGPEAPYRYGRSLPPIPTAIAPRIGLSVAAHRRRVAEHEVEPARRSASSKGTEIDLCYVDFGLDMNTDITRTAFGLTLQALVPPARTPGAREHSVLEWDIACRRCGAVVRHYYTDKFWNGRYLAHRREPQCKNAQPPVSHAAGSDGSSGRGIRRERDMFFYV